MTSTRETTGKEENGAAQAAARSRVYRWLSLGFRYPDEALIRRLKESAPAELEAACRLLESDGADELKQATRRLVALLPEAGRDRLEAAYLHIFGHLVRGPQISLYETEYGDGQSLRAVHELGDIAGFYRAFGLAVSRGAADRVDHVSVECAFVHFLCHKEAHAAIRHGPEQRRVCRKAQERFLKEHLGRWMPSMARRVLDRRDDAFYGAWAGLALAFLAEERNRFGLPPAPESMGLRRPEPGLEAGCTSCCAENSCPGGRNALAV